MGVLKLENAVWENGSQLVAVNGPTVISAVLALTYQLTK
jgi:hypothetical protein